MRPHRIAIVGLGKIVRDQHLPAILADPAFALLAGASPDGAQLDGAPVFPDHGAMLDAVPEIEAVAVCTPPQARYAIARDLLAAGRHVLLEKPPAATLSEVVALETLARRSGVSLFATWHSRFNAAVERAREALAGARVTRLTVTWKEDVRRWHPGQDWIWEPGGLGVFDPGINALSIVTHIMPEPVFVTESEVSVPENRQGPIAARLVLGTTSGRTRHVADFDWRQTGPQSWDIAVETAAGMRLDLAQGGRVLTIDGTTVASHEDDEYPQIYRRFDALIRAGACDVDAAPLRLVADAFLCGRRVGVEPFVD